MEGYTIFTPDKKPTDSERAEIVDFLFEHLGEYGDPKSAILACLKFAMAEGVKSNGGFALVFRDAKNEILGITIVNETGMSGYIPENILVYIAVHEKTRGKGVGKKIMRKAIDLSKGDVALHVEADNPAKHLYESLGFTSKYLEMRYEN